MTRPFLVIVAFAVAGCSGANSRSAAESVKTPVKTEADAVSRAAAGALEGCERYWRRLRGDEPTPDIPAELVRASVEMLPKFVPDLKSSPSYLSIAVPGGIDPQFKQIPHADYVDPWGSPYQLQLHSTREARAVSAGPDRELGTADDIGFPAMPEPLTSK